MEITVKTPAAEGYTVTIGSGLLAHCGERLAFAVHPCLAAVVTDSQVAPLYLETVCAGLRVAGFHPCSYVFPQGEQHKNLATLSEILAFFAENGLTRSDLVVALGGGVVGDMAGFAAAVYLRGVRCVQMPTTLLAAVDSSVGGKTAVDLPAGKNLVGTFHQPAAVLCDTDCFASLPESVFADGAAETIKYGVLSQPEILTAFSDGTARSKIADIAAACIRAKAVLVARDELDKGERQLLNFGHTAAHAIEKCSDYALSHGRAVSIGMVMMARAGERMGMTEEGTAAALAAILQKNGLPVHCGYSPAQLACAALADKKRRGEQITVIVPRRLGLCVLHTMPVTELKNLFALGGEAEA